VRILPFCCPIPPENLVDAFKEMGGRLRKKRAATFSHQNEKTSARGRAVLIKVSIVNVEKIAKGLRTGLSKLFEKV
jgi:hypothetical protein